MRRKKDETRTKHVGGNSSAPVIVALVTVVILLLIAASIWPLPLDISSPNSPEEVEEVYHAVKNDVREARQSVHELEETLEEKAKELGVNVRPSAKRLVDNAEASLESLDESLNTGRPLPPQPPPPEAAAYD